MVDIAKHPLLKEAYEVCLAIEQIHAGAEQTIASQKASDLLRTLESYLYAVFVDWPLPTKKDNIQVTVKMSPKEYYMAAAIASGECPHNSHEHEARAKWAEEAAEAMLKLNK